MIRRADADGDGRITFKEYRGVIAADPGLDPKLAATLARQEMEE